MAHLLTLKNRFFAWMKPLEGFNSVLARASVWTSHVGHAACALVFVVFRDSSSNLAINAVMEYCLVMMGDCLSVCHYQLTTTTRYKYSD